MTGYDAVVIGAGPAGERAAILAARAGKRVAIVERAPEVGGACINWGTIPSKTLRETALFVHSLQRDRRHGIQVQIPAEITVSEFTHRERFVVQRELELVNQVLDRSRIEVLQGRARLVDPHVVAILGADGRQRLQVRGEVIVLATGARPARPPEIPFDEDCVFDSDTILRLPRLPRSLTVLGAGVIGIEYASIFAALGVPVTLVDTRDRLLPYFDREIADFLRRELRRLGMVILHGERHASVERLAGAPPTVRVRTTGGNLLESEALLYCVGRDGNTRDLGLEAVGIQPDERGLLTVNGFYQTALPHVYAVGDVIGYPALASTSMEQGRQAVRHAFGLPGPTERCETIPFAIYSIPEASYVGQTEEELQERGADYVAGRGRYDLNPRGQISGETAGLMKLLFEGEELRLVGAHLVGHGASELIHTGQAYLQDGATAGQIAETIFNYPTLSDMYRHAALEASVARRRQREGG